MASDTKTREELLKGQILVGSFLSAFDPILRPFEDLAKHGISLSVGVIGLSGTAISVLGRSNPTDTRSATLLLMSWVVLIGSVVFGCLQLWRTAQFRDHIREFVLQGTQNLPQAVSGCYGSFSPARCR